MENKYHVFAGNDYYPDGGMNDYCGIKTIEQIKTWMDDPKFRFDWFNFARSYSDSGELDMPDDSEIRIEVRYTKSGFRTHFLFVNDSLVYEKL